MAKVEETYLYSIMNHGPIKLNRGIEIRSPKSLYLTKEDVLECLKKAHVYRRFANPPGKQEQVTTANIDRLHRAVYIPESEWENYVKNNIESKDSNPEQVASIVEEVPVTEDQKVAEVEVPEEVAELTSVIGEEQETLIEEAADDIVSDVIDEVGEDEIEDSVTIGNEDKQIDGAGILDESDNDNEVGASIEFVESQPQANAAKYTYHKRNNNNKHNKK